ncbi:MAG: hypothetical protein JSW27_15015 [Phycisphaerales bacterium]|nr:MAG: hypothetical protein JSW27_15015 [Phycisphaerales bacterium]
MVLALSVVTLAQDEADDERYDINRRGLDQLDRINEALHRYGKIFLKVGAVLAGIVLLKIISPWRLYYNASERLLRRAMRGVDELVRRIEKEAEETTSADPEEEPADGGVLAGMAEMAEFAQAEEVPSYVTTVNDRMLDNIRVTLKRLRRFREGHAERYRNYMFSVLKGIKTITEECVSAGVPSSLAVDVEEYFQDERRYKAWTKLLSHVRVGGENQEIADTFLVFVRHLKAGRPLVESAPAYDTLADTAVAASPQASAIPRRLSEETLPVIQRAATAEAKNLITLVQTGRPSDEDSGWQFEFVRRQRQLHQRDEAQRMLVVFLSSERNAWPKITRNRMLPCRTWPHVLYVLGVETADDLQQRVENRLLTIQEIIILEKAFLQTFAKRHSLEHVYGSGENADLMIDMHVPQIRRESLALLRRVYETEPGRFDRATQALNEAETPQHGEARKLIEHYVNRRRNPPDAK